MSSGGGYPAVDTTTPGHVAPMPLVNTIQAVRYEHVATVLFSKQSTNAQQNIYEYYYLWVQFLLYMYIVHDVLVYLLHV